MNSKIILILTTLCLAIKADSQDSLGFRLTPYFSAVVVKNIDSSGAWYQQIFELKVKNKINDPERGFRVVILESPILLVELIEQKSSLAVKKILEGQPEGTNIQGHFKFGFKIDNMDAFLKYLSIIKIPVDHIWGDAASKSRNFLIKDPDGNLIQFFE